MVMAVVIAVEVVMVISGECLLITRIDNKGRQTKGKQVDVRTKRGERKKREGGRGRVEGGEGGGRERGRNGGRERKREKQDHKEVEKERERERKEG